MTVLSANVKADTGASVSGGSVARSAFALARPADFALALLALLIIALMILPLPAWLLDALIAVNIASGVLLLLFSLYVATPLAFSTFPSVLLFTTLFRISLNVATTRQILLSGHAGDIIDAFGRIVVGGSLIVGLVVFSIITIVQFIVVAKGAERVAEVGARFTLDALPGKQMAIDSDLRAGLITAPEAMQLRERLGLESKFFGAMDGAMKFVKGDAAASIVIVIANLLGGLAIGVLVFGLPVGEAISKYSVLAIGDGLVTQLPALFIAMAAGVVVTRTSPEKGEAVNLASHIGDQISTQPRALILGGAVLALLAAVPGFPILPFVTLGAGVAFVGYRNVRRMLRGAAAYELERVPAATRDGDAVAEQVVLLGTETFALVAVEFRSELLARLSLSELNTALGNFRQAFRMNTGLPFPGVGLRQSSRPDVDSFWVLIREVPVRRVVSATGLTPKQAAEQIAREVQSVLQEHASELLGVQEARNIVALVERRYPDLVREANALLPLPRLAELLQQLVAEGVPVRDIRGILEAVVKHAAPTVTFQGLVNWVRVGIARDLSYSLMHKPDQIAAVTFTSVTEKELRAAIELDELGDRRLVAAPEDALRLADDLQALFAVDPLLPPVLLVSRDLRWALRRLLEPYRPGIRVVSEDEISRGVKVSSRGHVNWHGTVTAGPFVSI